MIYSYLGGKDYTGNPTVLHISHHFLHSPVGKIRIWILPLYPGSELLENKDVQRMYVQVYISDHHLHILADMNRTVDLQLCHGTVLQENKDMDYFGN